MTAGPKIGSGDDAGTPAATAGLLIRLWLEPGSDSEAPLRARLLHVAGGESPSTLAAAGDEQAVLAEVNRWVRQQVALLRTPSDVRP